MSVRPEKKAKLRSPTPPPSSDAFKKLPAVSVPYVSTPSLRVSACRVDVLPFSSNLEDEILKSVPTFKFGTTDDTVPSSYVFSDIPLTIISNSLPEPPNLTKRSLRPTTLPGGPLPGSNCCYIYLSRSNPIPAGRKSKQTRLASPETLTSVPRLRIRKLWLRFPTSPPPHLCLHCSNAIVYLP